MRHFAKALFAISIILVGSEGAIAQIPEGLEFKKFKKNRALSLRSCSIIKGFKRAKISGNGNTVELEGRKPHKLGAKFGYFACGKLEGAEFDSIYAKETESGEVTGFSFTASDFPKKKDPLKKYCKSVSGVTYLLKPASPGHIHDEREDGFALICAPGKKCPRFPAKIRYSDGEQAASVCYYGRWEGNGQSRAYCNVGSCGYCNARSIAKASSTKGRDGRVYIEYGDGTCAQADADGRNGSPH